MLIHQTKQLCFTVAMSRFYLSGTTISSSLYFSQWWVVWEWQLSLEIVLVKFLSCCLGADMVLKHGIHLRCHFASCWLSAEYLFVGYHLLEFHLCLCLSKVIFLILLYVDIILHSVPRGKPKILTWLSKHLPYEFQQLVLLEFCQHW